MVDRRRKYDRPVRLYFNEEVSIRDRILAGIEYDTNGGCWLWSRSGNKHQYGQIRLAGRLRLAHVVSYEEFKQRDHGGLHVLHRCDTPSCVNPSHLFLGTPAVNAADRSAKGRNCLPNYKIAPDRIPHIIADDRSNRIIAMEYGVTDGFISMVKNGKRRAKVAA